jgi:DNA repair exonuclease SbcCD ATPase subunit
MIKSLVLKNFQSHKEDSGKTAFIRALRWLVWNRPLGDEMRSNWGGQTDVEIHFEDGRRVIRKKGTSINEYHRLQDNATGYHRGYKAFGNDVPEEIREILNISEVNLQQQLDSPFLLTSTSGEVATHFNKIARLHKIDSSTKAVNKWIKEIDTKRNFKEGAVIGLKKNLEDYDYLDEFEADVEVLEEMEKKRLRLKGDMLVLSTLLDTIETVREVLDEYQAIIVDEELINNACQLQEEIDQKEEDIDQINIAIENITMTRVEIDKQNAIAQDSDLVGKAIDLNNRIQEKQERLDELNSLIDNITTQRKAVTAHKTSIKQLEDKFNQAFPDVCPLCGKPK